MKRTWMWAAPVLALGLTSVACDKKEEAPEASKEAPAVAKGAKNAPDKAEKPKVSTAKAVEHLPAGCSATVAVDFKAAASDKLVKEHLLKPLDANLARVLKSPDEDEKEVKETLDLLGIKSVTQLHSFAMCGGKFNLQSGDPESFGVIIAGELNVAAAWVQVAANFMTPENKKMFSSLKVGGVSALKNNEDNVIVAQAPSGAIVMASDEKMLESILKPSDAYKKYGLHPEHHLSIVITEKLAQEALQQGGKGSPLEAIKPGTFEISGSVNGRFSGTIAMDSEKEAKESAQALNVLMTQMAQAPDPATQQVLKSTKLEAQGSELKLAVELPAEMVAAGIAQLGKQLQAEIASKGPAKPTQ